MNNALENTSFIKWLWRHKLPILIVQVVACAAAVIFSSPYFIHPQYKSVAVVYPYNMAPYSRESSSEQMFQFLTSTDIKDTVAKQLALFKHYKIDTTRKFWYSELHDEYDKNINIIFTEYEAVQIEAYDESPDTAYRLVHAIIGALNRKVLATQKEKSKEVAGLFKRQLDIEKRHIDSLASISKQLSVQYGLLDTKDQTREVLRAYYQMLGASKGGKPMEETSTQVKNLEEKGQQFNQVDAQLADDIAAYDAVDAKYQDALKDLNKNVTYTNIVENPYPADRKSYPVRWIFILIACFAAFIFSVVVLRVMEKIKE